MKSQINRSNIIFLFSGLGLILSCGIQKKETSAIKSTKFECTNSPARARVVGNPVTTFSYDAALSYAEAIADRISNKTYPGLPSDCKNCGFYMEPAVTVFSFLVNKIEEVSSGLSTATGWGYKVTYACNLSRYVDTPAPSPYIPPIVVETAKKMREKGK